MRGRTVALVLGLPLAACGKGPAAKGPQRDLADFECNDRRAEYMVVGGFVADEAGVILECAESGPSLKKWRLGDKGERVASTHALGPDQFDATWSKIDSTGWRQLEGDCLNRDAGDGDPVYTFDIGDYGAQVSLTCTGKTLPFPFDRIVNELDLRAAGFGDQDD